MGFQYIDLKPVADKNDRYVFLEPIDYKNTQVVNDRIKEINSLSEDKLGVMMHYNKRVYSRLIDNKDILIIYPFRDTKEFFLNTLTDQGVDELVVKKIGINWDRSISELEESTAMKRALKQGESILDIIRV